MVIGKYRFLSQLSASSFSEVWLARPETGAPSAPLVVAKRLSAKLSPNASVAREYLSQAKFASQLDHPSIARVVDLCRSGDDTFVVREFVRGVNLANVIHLIGELGIQSVALKYAVLIVSSAAAALHHAFGAKDSFGLPLEVVHGAPNPTNIFVTMDGGVVLTDFGLTRALKFTKRGEVPVPKSRCLYFAPEQWRGLDPTHRSDIFALGTVLWELVTGRRLHDRADPKAIVNAACVEPAPAPSSVQRLASREIDQVALKALSKRPEDRYSGTDEMHRALEAYLAENARDASPDNLAGYVSALLPEAWKSWQRLRRAEAAGDEARVQEEIAFLFKGRRPAPEAGGQRSGMATFRETTAPVPPPAARPAAPTPPPAPIPSPVPETRPAQPVAKAAPARAAEPEVVGAPGGGRLLAEVDEPFDEARGGSLPLGPPAGEPAEQPVPATLVEPEPAPAAERFTTPGDDSEQTVRKPMPSAKGAGGAPVVSALIRWKGGIISECTTDGGRARLTVGSAPGCDIAVPEECVAGAPITLVEKTDRGWVLLVPPEWDSPGGGAAQTISEGRRCAVSRGDFSVELALAPPKRFIRQGVLRSLDGAFTTWLGVSAVLLAALMAFAILYIKAEAVTHESPVVKRHVKFLVSAVKTVEKKKEQPAAAKEEKIDKTPKVKEAAVAAHGSTVAVPKWVQPKKTTGKVGDLIASLAGPAPGAGKAFREALNLDAVRGNSSNSLMGVFGSFTVPGGLSGLGGLGGGGGGDIGTIGGETVTRGVGKVGGGGSGGKVRGSVSGVKALAKVVGSLDKEQVIRAINEHQHQIQACYERALIGSPGLSGKVTFEWTVDPGGRVSKAAEKSSTMGSPKVSECILGIIRKMRFPKPEGGSVVISFPFMFRSVQ
ncbi:MAG: serine/threonine protein kinase [Deltaproteobacteria bacterium]|nr:serine/threonine protein kinase [Deltaproteobacteria bacterium]